MKNKEYKLDFDVWKENFSPWSTKDIEKVINTIVGCRVGTVLAYKGTGSVRFDEDDEKNRHHPIIEHLDEYDKKNSKVLVFDTDESKLGFDKLFVYHYTGGSKGWAGFYFYSTQNPNKHIHRYYLDNESADITINLNRICYSLQIQSQKQNNA